MKTIYSILLFSVALLPAGVQQANAAPRVGADLGKPAYEKIGDTRRRLSEQHLTMAGVPAQPLLGKSQYSIFKPTPEALMREMSTDRPDKTESAYTVDAGHFQIEMDLVTHTRDRHNTDRDGKVVRSWGIAPMNLKAGLCNNVDFQLVLSTYEIERTADPTDGVSKKRGLGDITTRLKWNVWGNDGGQTALALMPYLKFPTNQDKLGNRSVEGGLIVPLAVELPAGWSMSPMTQLDIVRDENSRGYHPEFVNTITFGHDIIGNLAGYAEFFSSVSTEAGSKWVGTVDLGLTYAFTKNIQLDAGINIGVTRAADDLNPFLGLSWRF
ncbi:MAG: transporter [Pedosphaera sp.]|nr:transporter [Pedosphaera sp.]